MNKVRWIFCLVLVVTLIHLLLYMAGVFSPVGPGLISSLLIGVVSYVITNWIVGDV